MMVDEIQVSSFRLVVIGAILTAIGVVGAGLVVPLYQAYTGQTQVTWDQRDCMDPFAGDPD